MNDEAPAATAPSSAHVPRSASEQTERSVTSDSGDAVKLPDAAREFGLLTRSDIQREPRAVPLIHGLINKGQLIMIAGPSGSGKSVLQLHLSAAMQNASQVFGCIIPKPVRFLYINLEGELNPRLQAIEKHHEGWSFPDPFALCALQLAWISRASRPRPNPHYRRARAPAINSGSGISSASATRNIAVNVG